MVNKWVSAQIEGMPPGIPFAFHKENKSQLTLLFVCSIITIQATSTALF